MDKEQLREIATNYLLPFFSGAIIEPKSSASSARHSVVALRDPQSIYFKVRKDDKFRLTLFRSQPFTSSAKPIVDEQTVVQCFAEALSEIENVTAGHLKRDFLTTFQRRIVARAVGGENHEDVVLECIDQMMKWADRLYEGAPISACLGLRNTLSTEGLKFSDFCGLDVSAVLSNGFDTLLSFNFDSELIALETLPTCDELPPFCPMRQAFIAEWAAKKESRVAFSLNRLGEILIFKSKQLLFARRSAQWHFLTHEPVIAQMGVPNDKKLRTRIYETCLDSSFARTGACIGVASLEHAKGWRKLVVHEDDRLKESSSPKAQALRTASRGKLFQDLDRRVRQELAAIDGAIILSHKGEIHAVGAILKIPGGSSGGGRLAAAQALGAIGLGIKISQDGSITGFRGSPPEVAFRVM